MSDTLLILLEWHYQSHCNHSPRGCLCVLISDYRCINAAKINKLIQKSGVRIRVKYIPACRSVGPSCAFPGGKNWFSPARLPAPSIHATIQPTNQPASSLSYGFCLHPPNVLNARPGDARRRRSPARSHSKFSPVLQLWSKPRTRGCVMHENWVIL